MFDTLQDLSDRLEEIEADKERSERPNYFTVIAKHHPVKARVLAAAFAAQHDSLEGLFATLRFARAVLDVDASGFIDPDGDGFVHLEAYSELSFQDLRDAAHEFLDSMPPMVFSASIGRRTT
jgi:hypothetical protein